MAFWTSSGSEFQQSTEQWGNDESKRSVADRGFWLKGVWLREETGGM